MLSGNHCHDWVTTFPFNVLFEDFKHILGHPATKGNVIIGNNVWIGLVVIMLSGVNIDAHSVITKDVRPYSIVTGNPSRVVKMRFSDEVIKSLLKIKWWD